MYIHLPTLLPGDNGYARLAEFEVYGTTQTVGGPNATLTNVAYQKMAVRSISALTFVVILTSHHL